MKFVIKTLSGIQLWECEAETIREATELACKANAYLRGALFTDTTVLDTGETWKQYQEEVVPALLTAGGKAL